VSKVEDNKQIEELEKYTEKKQKKQYKGKIKELENLLKISTDKIMIYDLATEIRKLKIKLENLSKS